MQQSKDFPDFLGSELALDVDEILSLTSHLTSKNCNMKGFDDIITGDIKKSKKSFKSSLSINQLFASELHFPQIIIMSKLKMCKCVILLLMLVFWTLRMRLRSNLNL